ncbi:MAG: serine/threonine protein kinase [Deltaproteobacteria bacterium]|nr:serine/threonine protein kinase [Deltaproteobacteria bacterium]
MTTGIELGESDVLAIQALDSLEPLYRVGRYDLLLNLASGGTANVFLARHQRPRGRYVALKLMLPSLSNDPRAVEMFDCEARIMQRLHHPHLATLIEVGVARGVRFIALEYVFGISLARLLRLAAKKGRPLSAAAILSIASQICGALHHAHTCTAPDGTPLRIVHRDVTPQNILVGYDGVAKLIDFGVAKTSDRSFSTEPGVLKGKYAYLSPEQVKGAPVDHRSDLFSLGTVIWEALTGHGLFRGGSALEVLRAVDKSPIARPSWVNHNLPALLDPLLARALARPLNERFSSAEEMKGEIDALLGRSGSRMDPDSLARECAGILQEALLEQLIALRASLFGPPDTARLAAVLGGRPVLDVDLPGPPLSSSSDFDPSAVMISPDFLPDGAERTERQSGASAVFERSTSEARMPLYTLLSREDLASHQFPVSLRWLEDAALGLEDDTVDEEATGSGPFSAEGPERPEATPVQLEDAIVPLPPPPAPTSAKGLGWDEVVGSIPPPRLLRPDRGSLTPPAGATVLRPVKPIASSKAPPGPAVIAPARRSRIHLLWFGAVCVFLGFAAGWLSAHL